jgi:peptide/nickel transport system permease protein
MRAYIIRRILVMIPTIFLVTVVIFFMVRLLPGDLVSAMMSKAGDAELDRDLIAVMLGLDAPMHIQIRARQRSDRGHAGTGCAYAYPVRTLVGIDPTDGR